MALSSGAIRTEQLLLVGPHDRLDATLRDHGLSDVEICPATEVVGMDESPTAAIRTKKDSSIARGVAAVAEGKADAFVSAGNTGAVVAAASLILGRLPGVARPGIAVPVPTRKGPCVVIDVGANIYCKPDHMFQYAVMAAEYSRGALDRTDPRVGLLNIGEEDGKGNPLIQSVHGLLQTAPLNYAGFIEGQDIMSGAVDVVVCEGFVGNVILKVAEGLSAFMKDSLSSALAVHPPRPEVREAIGDAFTKLDYAEYGGAPLLGVAAPVLIGHGRSTGHAMMNMIRAAVAAVEHDINQHIVDLLAASRKRAEA